MKYFFKPQEIKKVIPSKNIMIDSHDKEFPLDKCITAFGDKFFDVEEYCILYSEDEIENFLLSEAGIVDPNDCL